VSVIAPPRRLHLRDCAWFWVWAVIGGCAAISFISGIGVFFLPVGAVLAFAAVRRERGSDSPSPLGLATGAGVPFLVVAYIQRKGPGTVCWSNATGGGCDSYLDPRPWLVIGVALVIGGMVAFAYRSRKRGQP
jgi:hypothetical protein